MKKTTQLRNLINSNQLELLMEAHSGLSAKIVEEVGFKGIWASGLSISAAMGVRDNNEASWTQVLEVLEFMSDATSIPILLDGDTGYGNFNNARRLVKKLEQRDIAGVCIEDKQFPKTNSFIKGEAQPLADIDEFCNKIRAMKDTQKDDDFVVISRIEALIAGWGLEEALRRAEAYRQAGTDAILIHSKRSDFIEIETFMKEWGDRLPVVIVPTKYYSVPTERFREMGISLAIWANHNLRASIKAMEQTTKQIYLEESLINIESKVAPLERVFQLQDAEELAIAEKKYLSDKKGKSNSIVFLRESEEQSLLNKQIQQFNTLGLKEVYVTGNTNTNDHQSNNEVYRLIEMREKIKGSTVFSYSDIYYKQHVLEELLNDPNDITIIVDADFERGPEKNYVTTNHPYSKKLFSKTVDLIDIFTCVDDREIHGEFIGLWKVTEYGAEIVKEAIKTLVKDGDVQRLTLKDLFNYIRDFHPISVQYIKGGWLDLKGYTELQQNGEKI
ncbi:phosphoenolpyruvate mutase [Bacillus massilinigeriensis]|uniref:phosphoenolpyruvate mutase n=1 Tax=Bacillus massilionigeriensis TaxID=1805475 RepID=UPI00096AE65A|nr:phosphoenolpyruvate mutase [Bacillus massilionigeriensis]